MTSELRAAPLLRVDIEPGAGNGLRKPSQVMLDKAVIPTLIVIPAINIVIPAQARIQCTMLFPCWIPACAGMTSSGARG